MWRGRKSADSTFLTNHSSVPLYHSEAEPPARNRSSSERGLGGRRGQAPDPPPPIKQEIFVQNVAGSVYWNRDITICTCPRSTCEMAYSLLQLCKLQYSG
ncbi:hypothetical protein J6590_078579 [Homalodisca vitripennis]|nr:hypothetical protein J6590_078579 [Homalodisca vitripennis]